MKKLLLFLSLISLSLGCTSGGGSAPAVDCGPGGGEHRFLIQQMTIDLGEAAASAGFDLDGFRTVPGGSATGSGCGKPDYMGIEGITGGVDNALGPALQSISAVIDVPGELSLALNTGSLLMLVRVAAVDDLVNDDCVEVGLLQGLSLDPPSDMATTLDGAEAIAIDPASLDENGDALILSAGTITGGMLEVRDLSISLPFSLPYAGAEVPIDIRVERANLQAPITASALGAGETGIIGGAITLGTIIQLVEALGYSEAYTAGFAARADLHLDTPVGEACDALSAGLSFGAVEATDVSGLEPL